MATMTATKNGVLLTKAELEERMANLQSIWPTTQTAAQK